MIQVGDYDGIIEIRFKDNGSVVDTYNFNEVQGDGWESMGRYVFSYSSDSGNFYLVAKNTISDINEICFDLHKAITGANIDFNTTSSNSILFTGTSEAVAWDPDDEVKEICLTIN